ncbi:MAG: hypothetical protein KUG82_21960 [Pseudomonadales bacterium]|nr:hypothetical protein [Pseudomonadales bacterium]
MPTQTRCSHTLNTPSALSTTETRETTIVDHHRWSRQLQGRRIPQAKVANFLNSSSTIDQANALWEQTKKEAEQLKSEAYQEGLILGRNEATAEMATLLATAQKTAQQFLEKSNERLIKLATAITKRILPQLESEHLVSNLIVSALEASRANQFLRIRVHPSALAATQSKLEGFKQYYSQVDSITIIADSTLSVFGCVVESEAGVLHAGLQDQLDKIENNLLLTSHAPIPTDAGHD